MKENERERSVERYFKQEVEKRGGFVRKYTSPGRRGVPDRIMFLHGVVFVELKRLDGELARLQVNEIKRMQSQGALVVVLPSRSYIDEFITKWEKIHESNAVS